MNGHLELWQGCGGTLIATLTANDLAETFQTDTYTLSGTEAGNITNYADLCLITYYTYTGGGGPSSYKVDYIELQVPDAGPPPTAGDVIVITERPLWQRVGDYIAWRPLWLQ
jgi:hypothetical protein